MRVRRVGVRCMGVRCVRVVKVRHVKVRSVRMVRMVAVWVVAMRVVAVWIMAMRIVAVGVMGVRLRLLAHRVVRVVAGCQASCESARDPIARTEVTSGRSALTASVEKGADEPSALRAAPKGNVAAYSLAAGAGRAGRAARDGGRRLHS